MDYRLGASYEGTPVSDNNLYPDLPDALKFALGAGATRFINDTFSIDASFLLENHSQRKESDNNENFNGSYQKTVYSLGLGAHYEF